MGDEYRGAYNLLDRLVSADRKQQLFLRSMTNGNIAERDRLIFYTLGEFYSEMSLFITECDTRERELEKLRSKR